jgi:hypothetical protein
MEETLSKTQIENIAKEMAEKGKADFFIKDTLLKKGADPEIVNELFEKLTAEKNARSKKDMLIGLIATIFGVFWLILCFSNQNIRMIIANVPGIGRFILTWGPFGYGVLMLIKGKYKLKKLI